MNAVLATHVSKAVPVLINLGPTSVDALAATLGIVTSVSIAGLMVDLCIILTRICDISSRDVSRFNVNIIFFR